MHITGRRKITIVITDRWENETKEPNKTVLNKTLDDVFLDNALPDVSITDGDFYLDTNKNGWVYLSDGEGHEYYMKKLEEEKIRQLWRYFYEGKLDYVLAEPWIEGISAFNGDWSPE